MLIQDQAKTANPEAMGRVTEALLRIWMAHASGNNGTVNGESVLCEAHALEAKAALEAAGLTLPDFESYRRKARKS